MFAQRNVVPGTKKYEILYFDCFLGGDLDYTISLDGCP